MVTAEQDVGDRFAAPDLRLGVLRVFEQTVVVALKLKALVVTENARLQGTHQRTLQGRRSPGLRPLIF